LLLEATNMVKLGWWVLLLGAVATCVCTAIYAPGGPVVAAVILSIFALCLYGFTLSHFLGIRRKVVRHLGRRWMRGEVVTHIIQTSERVDLQLTLDRLRAEHTPATKTIGYAISYHAGIVGVISQNPKPVPLAWESYQSSATQMLTCATNALYLLRNGDQPFCAMVGPRRQTGKVDRKQVELSVLAATREVAQAALALILSQARRNSVYRGAMLSLERSEDRHEPYAIKFLDLPPVPRDQIILPAEVMEVVERNVLGLLAHGPALRRAGSSTRHGVLFHGPPGTGKTLVTRYLSRARPEYTAIVLTGRQLSLIRESCQLARLLAPSMLILEDVDLVASERSRNRHNTVLHELMDEMDGMGEKTDCVFLLTTNRPDILEPALAARPGRVDQAIFFPLPDLDCRRQLLNLYARKLDLSAVQLEPLLQRTAGTSPAFLAELVRKAVLMAAERGEQSDPLRLTNDDFNRAVRELIEFGGELTQKLLGFGGQKKS
jgi:hypothetical protein